MRITKALLAASMVAITASSAMAGSNKTFLWQAGDYNSSTINQLGYKNKMGKYSSGFRQGKTGSSHNTLNVKQDGNFSKIARDQSQGVSYQYGNHNAMTLTQLHHSNDINTVRQNGTWNVMNLKQHGSNNEIAYVSQTGNSDSWDKGQLIIDQDGFNHMVVRAEQNGAGSYMYLSQKGHSNTVTLASQTGDDNSMKLYQYAGTHGNDAELKQNGDNNAITVYQKSNHNFAVVNQNGNNLVAVLTQD